MYLPVIYLLSNYDGGNEDNGDLLQKVPWCTAAGIVPILQQATANSCLHQRHLDTNLHVWVSLFRGHCSFLLVLVLTRCFVFVFVFCVCMCPSGICFPALCKFGGCMVELMVTSSKRVYAIPRSTAFRAPLPATVLCWPVPPQETLKHSSVSVFVGSLGPGAHKVCLSPLSISGKFWGLILNAILSLLPSYWGFSICPWTWSISSKSLQHHTATTPVLHSQWRVVAVC